MKSVNVVWMFVEDHKRIAALLTDFKKNKYKSSGKTLTIFNQLNKALRTHFKEEEIQYANYKIKTGNILPILKTIGIEHEILLEKLDRIKQSLKDGIDIDCDDFYSLLLRHKNIEERLLYPELENIMSEKEKEDVYMKIKVR